MARTSGSHEYPDDIFDHTRMSFGDHIEELRMRMIRALLGLVVCLVIGFVLDAVGESLGKKNIGVGRPMLDVITDPVESQVRDFYYRRTQTTFDTKLPSIKGSSDDKELQELSQRAKEGGLASLSASERQQLLGQSEKMPIIIQTASLAKALGLPADKITKPETEIEAQVYPAYVSYLSEKGQTLLESRKYLTTLSAQEAFVVYFKVSILCGIILSSPWLLWQFWAFVGAGLYPHEKRLLYMFFWPSLLLFLSGVLLCQFVVLPGAVKALLMFNEFLGFDPDLRLNEWLGLAIILPLVFGVSFQTPLVMIFLNRIGIFSAQDYAAKWRYACFILAFLSAIITPTPDVVTMSYLFAPLFGLYLMGILFCYLFPGFEETPDDEMAEEEVAV